MATWHDWLGGGRKPVIPGEALREPHVRRLAAVAYVCLTLGSALLVFLGLRHHPIADQVFADLWLPAAFVLTSLLYLAFIARLRISAATILLLLDLMAWLPLLALIVAARTGQTDPRLWLAIAICAKAGALLLGLGVAAAGSRISDRAVGWLLCGVAILFYLAPLPFTRLDRGLQLKGDEPHYLVTTISLLNDRDFFVENEYAAHVYAPFYDRTLDPPYHAVPARDGHIASFHDSGVAVLSTAPYAIGGWVMVLAAIAMIAGLTVREIYRLTRTAGADSVAGLAATSLVGFSLPFAVFATQIYPEVPAALATTVGVRQLLAASTRQRASPLIAGLALAVLPWLHVRFWALVLPLLLAAGLTWRRMRERLKVIVPVVVFGLAYVGLNYAVYGQLTISPFLFHESVGSNIGTLVTQAGGLVGVVLDAVRPWFDPYDGALWLSPIYILALAAVPLALRGSGLLLRITLATVAVYSVFVGLHYLQSTSGDSPPGRLMVTVLPLLALPLASSLQPRFRAITLWAAALLAAVGAATTVVALSEPLLARYPNGGLGGPVAILGRDFGLPLGSVALALGALAVLAFLLYRTRRSPRNA